MLGIPKKVVVPVHYFDHYFEHPVHYIKNFHVDLIRLIEIRKNFWELTVPYIGISKHRNRDINEENNLNERKKKSQNQSTFFLKLYKINVRFKRICLRKLQKDMYRNWFPTGKEKIQR
uniref:Uncharacterized protein n=1 Tax=Cacopsylla melanoneura TaxID=428564 RepID=A0A8D8S809_9HEMI